MKTFFLKAAVAVWAIVGVSSAKVEAQTYNLVPTQVQITPAQYSDIEANPTQTQNLLRLNANYDFQVTDGVYPEVPVGGGPVTQPCVEQMTPALSAQCQAEANRLCQNIYTCVQGANCAWYLYLFKPNDPRRCPQIALWPAYTPELAAYRVQ